MENENLEWETHEGITHAYSEAGDEVIEILPAEREAEQAKWGNPYTSGRAWTVKHGTHTARGRSISLTEAKKAAVKALRIVTR